MRRYYKEVQFINLPELTNGLDIGDKAWYVLNEIITKIRESAECQVEVGNGMINIMTNKFFSRRLIFMKSTSITGNSAGLASYDGSVWIHNTAINEFITEQLSIDNDTLFIPKLI